MRKTESWGWSTLAQGHTAQGKQPFPESFICLYLPSKEERRTDTSPKAHFSLSRMGKPLGLQCLPPTPMSRPTSVAGISSITPGASFLLTEGQGSGEETPVLSPKWPPGQWDSEGSGECWVLTSQSREARATVMQASWGPSSASRCLRNVLSWELPPSFPPHPQPMVPLLALALPPPTPSAPPLSSLPGRPPVHCPSGTVPQSGSLSVL